MEISQHCEKFIYKHSDISIFTVCQHSFFFFVIIFLPAQELEKFFYK